MIPPAYNTGVLGFSNVIARLMTAAAPMVGEYAFPFPLQFNFTLFMIGFAASTVVVDKLPKTI